MQKWDEASSGGRVHVHILGICGTFMGGVAALAKAEGHHVTGSDANVYPPMSTQLESLGIALHEGWGAEQFATRPDMVVIGNALSRGNPAVEYVLDNNLPYTSGALWLSEHLLRDRWVLAVAGTHGKTTTTSMLAWILEHAGLAPGFLIGGIPGNFGISARLGEAPFFVVEADEYDTAFFDKRSKFVHYRPRTVILNNLEFDHADIFPDLASIERQFHHLVRTVPGNGLIVVNNNDDNLSRVLEQGCWTPRETFGRGGDWSARALDDACRVFEVSLHREIVGRVDWSLTGQHNMDNALAALAAARHAGVMPKAAIDALCAFEGVKRRMELRESIGSVRVYDDFAHHPTAIRLTLEGARHANPGARIVAVFEPRSNTMRLGVHRNELRDAFAGADRVHLYQPPYLDWSMQDVANGNGSVATGIDELVATIVDDTRDDDVIVIMSNGGFGGLHGKLIKALQQREGSTA